MDVRFTKSQTSFKTGRLSPKLYNRIDTKQYDSAASEMKGFRVIPEGGAEAIRGKRWINDRIYNPNIGFDDAKLFSFSINGRQCAGAIVSNTFNEVNLYVYRYPYEFALTNTIPLVSAGSTFYDPDLFDFAVVDNYLVLVHFSGLFQPAFLKFDDEANYDGLFRFSVGALNQPYGNFREEQLTLGNAQSTGSAIGAPDSIYANLAALKAVWGEYYSPRTIDITSTDSSVVSDLQAKTYFYLEGFGRNGGNDFTSFNFYWKMQNITNGVRVFGHYFYNNFTEEAMLDFANITEVNTWTTDYWGEDNWPKTVTSHEGRLVFGGTPEFPFSLRGSRVSNPFNLNHIVPPSSGNSVISNGGKDDIKPTDPYFFTISTDEDSEITAIRSSSELFVGTDRREYIVTGGDTIISALSIQSKPYTSQGVYPVSTEVLGNYVAYLDVSRKGLFQFKYNNANGTFLADELSTLFNDLIEGDRIKEICWAPHVKVLYILMESRVLYGLTYDPSTETMAFFETLQEDVVSITYIGARDENAGVGNFTISHMGEHLLMYVEGKGLMAYEQTFYEKGIDNSYILDARREENEYLYWEDVYEIYRDPNFPFYYINQETYTPVTDTGDPAKDLFPVPTKAPVFAPPFQAMNMDTGEVVTIENTEIGFIGYFLINHPAINGASRILVGNLPNYEKILATMPIEAGQQYGPAQLGIKNIDEIGMRFYKSYSYEISSDGENWQELVVADGEGKVSTGRKETKFRGNPKYDFRVWVRQTKPEPLVITGINMRGLSNDG